MANLYDQDEEPLIMRFVDDPVVADTQSIGVFPLEFLDIRGARKSGNL